MDRGACSDLKREGAQYRRCVATEYFRSLLESAETTEDETKWGRLVRAADSPDSYQRELQNVYFPE